ncbi:class I SAM-dependent methyltransferase [Ornithinimicrobium sp. Y1847]|uniref:class I SAM-dependent methyltransferase n=1 Tax=unclassified Ornithinimicrobium TaxID=2615080 RepID=UPI003B682A57
MTQPVEPITHVRISPEEGYAANRENWDGRARVHLGSQMYGVADLVSDPDAISSVVRRDLELWRPHLATGDADGGAGGAGGAHGVEGLDLVHLQCHIGTDTLSWSRLGARCTGIDLSPVSLELARDIADRAGQEIRFIESNVLTAADAVSERFDLVYTSTGTICWLHDLTAWAQQIARLLRPGGSFFFRDSHPFANALEDLDATALTPAYRYFPLGPGEAHTYADGLTYTDGDQGLISQPRNYEWPHSVAEVLSALIGAGLQIVAVEEQDDLPWPIHPSMTLQGEAYVLPERWRDRVPVAWSVVARSSGEAGG